MAKRLLARLGSGRFGAIRLALLLAIPTIPIVAWALANPTRSPDYTGRADILFRDALTISTFAVGAAALAGGFVGGLLKRRATLSIFATVAVAWFIGMTSVSVISSLLAIPYEGTVMCIGSCNAFITSENPISGAIAWGVGVGASSSTIVPLLIAAVLVWGGRSASRHGQIVEAAVPVVFAHGIMQFMSFAVGGAPALAAYVCLALGVVIWASIVVPAPIPDQPTMPVEPVPSPVAV